MKIATGNRLNEFWEELKGVLVPKSKVLKTLEEIEANTNEENIAGATALKEVNYNLMSGLGGNKLIYNESEDAYYIQHGADAALKKLGSTVLPLLGLDYTGSWACMTFSVKDISKLDEFKLTAMATGVYYQLTDDHGLIPDYAGSTTSGFNNQFTVNVTVDILSICKNSTKKYFKIVTSALLYGADHPFELFII